MDELAPDDPRVARSKAVIIEATLELLAERGVADTTVEAIAERSGVAKTTIYRHWDDKAEVVLSALDAMLEPPQDPDSGELRQDLEQLLTGLARSLSDSPVASLLPSLIDAAERDPAFAKVHRRFAEARHRIVRGILQRGLDRGELRADADLEEVMESLAGPLFYRRLVRHEPIPAARCVAIVDAVLHIYGTQETQP